MTCHLDCNVSDSKNCLSNMYYLVNKVDKSLITDEGVNGSLYYCILEDSKSSVSCAEVNEVGYYIVDRKTIYSCRIQNNIITCQRESIPENSNSCTADSIGKLYAPSDDSTSLSLCLNFIAGATSAQDKALSVKLDGSAIGTYIVAKNPNPAANVFGITGTNEQYAIVGIADRMVRLNDTYTNGHRYVYADNTSNRVMEKADKAYPKIQGSTTGEPDEDQILELLCSSGRCKSSDTEVTLSSSTKGINIMKTDGTDVVEADYADTDTEAKKIRMYNCDDNGNCEKISGYVRLPTSGEYYYISTSEGTDEGAHAVEDDTPTDGCKDKLGLVYFESGTIPKLCLDQDFIIDLSEIPKTADQQFITGTGGSYKIFQGIANKMIKVQMNSSQVQYIYVDSEFKGITENDKRYILNVNGEYKVYSYDASTSSFHVEDKLDGVQPFQHVPLGASSFSDNVYSELNLADSTLIQSTLTKWAIFNCLKGKTTCQRTYGYLKTNDGKYYSIPYTGESNNTEVNAETMAANDCGASDTGELLENGEICLVGDGTSPIKGAMANGNYYLISINTQEKVIFSALSSSKSLIIKATANSLTYQNIFLEKRANLFVGNHRISTSDILDADSGNLTANKAKLTLFDCDDKGVCVQISGYALNGEKIYKIATSLADTAYSPIETNDCTSNIGSIIKYGTDHYICLDNNLKINLTQTGYYAFGTNEIQSSTPFDNKESKMIKITNDFIFLSTDFELAENGHKIIIKDGNKYTIYNQNSQQFSLASPTISGILIYDNEAGTNIFKEITIPESVTEEDIVGWTLFDCTANVCERTYGYVKIAEGTYLSVPREGSNGLLSDEDIENLPCTSASHVGSLVKDGKLCVVPHATAGSEKTFQMANDKKYVLSGAEANLFAPASSDTHLIVKSTETSFTLDVSLGVQLMSVDSASKEVGVINYSSADNLAKIGLYRCSAAHTCTKLSGYTRDDGKFYTVNKETGASLVTPAEAACAGNIGKIVKDSGDLKYFCLITTGEGTLKLPLATQPTGYYILGSSANEGPLISKRMIEIGSNYIVVDDSLDNTSDTSYLLRTGAEPKYTAYAKSEKLFSVDTSLSGIQIFEIIGTTNIYRAISDLSKVKLADISGILIFNCSNGTCTPIPGYLLVSEKYIITCTVSTCSYNLDKIRTSQQKCDAADKLKLVNGKLSYCFAGENIDPVEMDSANIYFVGNKQYVINTSKTIIANTSAADGHYLVKNNVVVTDNTAGDTLIGCVGNACTPTLISGLTVYGYYIDAVTSGNLILCTQTPKSCTLIATNATDASPKYYLEAADSNPSVISCKTNGCVVENETTVKGYFINSVGITGKAVISCDGTQCSELADVSTCSVVGKVKVSGGKVYFCVSTTDADPNHVEIKIDASRSESTKSFKLAGNGDFPGFNQNDYISVKIGKDGTVLYQAPAEATELPVCAQGTGSTGGNPVSATAYCNRSDGGSFAESKVCIKNDKTTIYISNSGPKCDPQASVTANDYVVFKCTDALNCEQLANLSTVSTGSEKLLLYQYSGSAFVQKKGVYYLTTDKLIKCEDDGRCALVVHAGYYDVTALGNKLLPDKTVTMTNVVLIEVDGNKAASTKDKTAVTTLINDGKYFLDGTSYEDSDKYSKLIKCTASGGNISCASYVSKNSNDVYLNAAGSGATGSLIRCDGTYFIPENAADKKYYMSGDPNNKLFIECLTAGCSKGTLTAGKVYVDEGSLNGAVYTKLIKCGGQTVTCTSSSTTEDDVGYYANGAAETTTIIQCVNNNGNVECSVGNAPAIGYYKNTGKTHYTSCSTVSNCDSYTPVATDCTAALIGKINSSGKICLDAAIAGDFTEGKQYLINIGGTINFPSINTSASDKFRLLSATINSITLDTSETTPIKVDGTTLEVTESGTSKYTYFESNYVYVAPCEITDTTGAHCSERYYFANSDCSSKCTIDDEATTGTNLFSCGAGGTTCNDQKKPGIYIKSTTEYYDCTSISCTKKTDTIATKSGDCVNETQGKLYETSSNTFHICLKGSGVPTQLTAEIKVIPYYLGNKFGTKSGQYAIVDTTAKSIALKSDASGYYMIKDNAIINSTSGQEGSIMVECTSGICSPVTMGSSTAGYYRNAADINDATLINCRDSACELESRATGFYILNNGDILECGAAGSCNTPTTNATGSCNANNSTDGKITTGATPTLCLNGSKTASLTTGTTVKYYLSNGSTFGSGSSIVKVTKNSFTLSTSGITNVCVDEDLNVTDDSTCTNKTKYTCSSGTSCTSKFNEKQICL